jgi:hypothetical protein
MFRAPSWTGPLFARPVSLGGKPPSREGKPALPAPLADWSGNPFTASSPLRAVLQSTPFHRLPAEIGPSVACRTVLPLPAVWRGGVGFSTDTSDLERLEDFLERLANHFSAIASSSPPAGIKFCVIFDRCIPLFVYCKLSESWTPSIAVLANPECCSTCYLRFCKLRNSVRPVTCLRFLP